jgi:hypothetical protein
MIVTAHHIAAAYTMLREFPPFRGWRLPPATEVHFEVIEGEDFGHYNDHEGRHAIGINADKVLTLRGLIYTVAHEMTHMRQELTGKRPGTKDDQHNKAFNRMGQTVCRKLMIPPDEFF